MKECAEMWAATMEESDCLCLWFSTAAEAGAAAAGGVRFVEEGAAGAAERGAIAVAAECGAGW